MTELQRLLSGLYSKNDNFRISCVKGLANYKDQEVADHLIKLLSDYNPDIRIAAAGSLGKLGDERAVNHLLQALSDTNKDFRQEIVTALGRLGDFRAISRLKTIIRLDHSQEVRKAAEKAMEEIEVSIQEMLDTLEAELESPEAENRRRAVRFLATIGTKNSLLVLLKAIVNPDREVQVQALEAIDKLKSLGAEPFIRGLENKDWKVRMSCCQFLGRLKTEEALEALVDLTDIEDNLEVKKSIASALGEIGLEDALYHLRHMIDISLPELNKEVVSSIYSIKGHQSISYLIIILREEDEKTAGIAQDYLIKKGYEIIPSLLEEYYDPKDKNKVKITQNIIMQLGNDAVDYFLQNLNNSAPEKRLLAVEFLGDLAAKNAIDALSEVARDDSDRNVKKAAARVLGILRKKYKTAASPSFKPSSSLLHRVSTFFSEQIEKISKVKKPTFGGMFKKDKLTCSRCGGIISRRASTVELDSGRVDILRFGMCPLCEKIFCKGCSSTVVIRGYTTIKCPSCNVELTEA